MKEDFIQTKNVKRFFAALNDLRHRPGGLEGMGLLYGRPGEGKTTVISRAAGLHSGVYVRAGASWTMTSLLQTLTRELNLSPGHRRASMVDAIVEELSITPRPVFIDEADYLLRDRGTMLDVVRDLYDLSKAPIVMIGMETFARDLSSFGQGRMRRRISQFVEFTGLDEVDSALVMRGLCDVALSDDLCHHVFKQLQGNVGNITIAVSRIEAVARANGLDRITLSDWGNRKLRLDFGPSRRGGAK